MITNSVRSANGQLDSPSVGLAISTLPRICLLTESFYPILGGGENHARQLGNALCEAGVSVFVLTRMTLPNLAANERVDRMMVRRVQPSGLGTYGKYLMLFPAALHLVRNRQSFDVIYVCGFRVLGVVSVIAAKLLGKTTILRAESSAEMSGDFVWRSPQLGSGRVMRSGIKLLLWIRNQILRRADHFVSISDSLHNELLAHGITSASITRIRNGVDTARFVPVEEAARTTLRQKLNIPTSARVLVYSGKLNRGKGLGTLLRVWRNVVDNRDDVHLVLVGSGENQVISCEDELRLSVQRLGLNEHVTFTGFVEKVEDYLQSADYFVLPSESEGHPISLLEALACGLPSIATRIGGIVDIIRHGENGWLVEPIDEKDLYDGIMMFINDPARAHSFGKSGRKTILQHFGLGNTLERHLQLLSDLRGI